MNTKQEKHRVVAIMITWPGHKFLITAKHTRVAQRAELFDELMKKIKVITQRDHTEVWRETEKTITAAEKPFKMQYALFFENSPMFGGEREIKPDFKHGDLARSILKTCKQGGEWTKMLTNKRKEEVMEVYKKFRESHEIIVTHE